MYQFEGSGTEKVADASVTKEDFTTFYSSKFQRKSKEGAIICPIPAQDNSEAVVNILEIIHLVKLLYFTAPNTTKAWKQQRRKYTREEM